MKQFKTKSGLRVLLAPRNETQTMTLSLICGAGSRNEDEKNSGISHFVEHMMFKGTKKRPVTLDISKELDGVGAVFNAYTSKDHTNYYIKIAAEKSELAFDIISDMIKNSKFDADDIKKEKGVIIEEMKMYEDNPTYYIEDLFEKLIFDGHELGRFIIGNRKTVTETDQKMFKEYLNKMYQPQNMVLSIAGKFDTVKIKKLVNKYFKFKPNSKKFKLKKFKSNQIAPRASLLNKKTEQVHLALGFPAYNYEHKNITAMFVMSTILGGNMSSRLFINIREKQGLCYFIKAIPNIYQDTGNLMIQAGLDKSRIKLAIPLIIQELEDIKNNQITEEELKRAQDFLAGQIVIQMEDSENIANYFGKQEILTGKTTSVEDKIKKIKKVTTKDIQKVAQDIIKINKLNLAIVGPFNDVNIFKKLINNEK